MKKYLALFVALIFAFGSVYAQPQVEDVSKALNGGDIENIIKYLDKVVAITLNNDQSTYSRSQAEMVLRNFLSRNPAKTFQVKYKGNASSDNSFFLIGELRTTAASHGTFKVYFFFKEKEKLYFLQEIKFEQ